MTENKRNIGIKEAARMMGKSEMFVRIGLQRGILTFGVATKMPNTTKYSYHISPKLFNDYLGINCVQDEKEDI